MQMHIGPETTLFLDTVAPSLKAVHAEISC